MVNPNGARGAKAERDIANYLVSAGFPHADRRIKHGSKDRGDITGIPGVVIEAKDTAKIDLAGELKEAHVEAENDGGSIGLVWHKRRGKGSPADWYVIMDGATLVELLRTVEHARNLEADKVAERLARST